MSESETNFQKLYEAELLKNKSLSDDNKYLNQKNSRLKKDTIHDIHDIEKLKSRLKNSLQVIDNQHKKIQEYKNWNYKDSQKIISLKDENYELCTEISILKQNIEKYQNQLKNYYQYTFIHPPLPAMPPGMPPAMPPGMPPVMPEMSPVMPDIDNFNYNRPHSLKRDRYEEVAISHNKKYKTKRCYHFNTPGGCYRGERCTFIH